MVIWSAMVQKQNQQVWYPSPLPTTTTIVILPLPRAMSHGQGSPHPHPPHILHRKAVPPGSLLYEQSGCYNYYHYNNVNGETRCDKINNPLDQELENWKFQTRARGAHVNGGSGCCHSTCNAYASRVRRLGGEGEGQIVGRKESNAAKRRGDGGLNFEDVKSLEAGFDADSCSVQVCDFVEDLNVRTAGTSWTETMGHSPSLLLHHRHHKRDYLVRDRDGSASPRSAPNPNQQHHHSRDVPSSRKRHSSGGGTATGLKDKGKGSSHDAAASANSNSRVTRSRSLPAATSRRSHVISWSASSDGEHHPRFVIEDAADDDDDDVDDDLGSSSDRSPHAPLSRLYPRVSSASTQRQSLPSPNRVRNYENPRGRPQSSPPGERGGGRQGEKGQGEGRRRESGGKSPTPSPKRGLFPDVYPTRGGKNPGTASASPTSYPLSHSSPTAFQRRASQELPRGGGSSHGAGNSSSNSLFIPSPIPPPSSSQEHVRLCKFTVDHGGDLSAAGNLSPTDDSCLPEIPDFFRMRSQSDVSMHLQRNRRLPRLPLLRQRMRMEEEEEEGEVEGVDNHVHVHWADERRGSPLATSVLLNSLRPRALSHGSADLPRKPILKKSLGF
ncbi:hypothetical protein ACOMHN_052769 [Nucella lapillus]